MIKLYAESYIKFVTDKKLHIHKYIKFDIILYTIL